MKKLIVLILIVVCMIFTPITAKADSITIEKYIASVLGEEETLKSRNERVEKFIEELFKGQNERVEKFIEELFNTDGKYDFESRVYQILQPQTGSIHYICRTFKPISNINYK